MEKHQPIGVIVHRPQERAREFIDAKLAQGFSGPEIGLLASMHQMFSRRSVQVSDLGRFSVLDITDSGQQNIAQALEGADGPGAFSNLRSNLFRIWAGAWGEKHGDEDIKKVYRSLNYDPMIQRMDTWCQGLGLDEAHENPDTLLAHVAATMSSRRLDVPTATLQGRSGLDRLHDVAKAAGLYALTWSSWRYPEGEEEALAAQVEAAHLAIEQMSGLEGPCLGLAGLVRMSLDDDSIDHGATLTQVRVNGYDTEPGRNHFGELRIYLSPSQGWHSICHEWIHALDHACGDLSTKTMRSEMDAGLQHEIEQLECTDEDPALVRQWLEDHREKALGDARNLMALQNQPPQCAMIAQATQEFYRSLDAGDIQGSVNSTFRKFLKRVDPENYFNSWKERLAYASDRAGSYLSKLPTMDAAMGMVLFNGTDQERQAAARGLIRWMGSAPVKALWKSLNREPHLTPLVDAIERRRMMQQASTPQAKRAMP